MVLLEQRKTHYFARLLYLSVANDGQGIDRLFLERSGKDCLVLQSVPTALNCMESRNAERW